MSTSTRSVIIRWATAGLVALTVVGCGSGGEPDATSAPPTTATSVLGPVDRATGTPVKIGWSGPEQPGEVSDATRGATAVAGYANTYLGGLAGRPIELVTCADRTTAEGGQACAEQFVRAGVTAVVAAQGSLLDTALPTLTEAGIPLVLNASGSAATLRASGVFLLRNPLSFLATAAAYAEENRVGSVVLVVPDTPAALEPARAFAPQVFGASGVGVTVLPVALTVTDDRPQLEQAEQADPGMYVVTGDAGFCTTVLTAIREVGSDAKIVSGDYCIGEDRGASVPGGLEGVQVITQAVLDPADPETALFAAVLDGYGEEVGTSAASIGGYQAVLSLVRAVNAVGPDELTPATTAAALRQAPATPYPLGGGADFRCDGRALAQLSPNVCATTGFMATAHADGSLSDYRVVDTT
jgi:branched-chain amino acid transport system substrate-binding protein